MSHWCSAAATAAEAGGSSAEVARTEGPPRFVALSYNILAKSLGSNCIPWVMTASKEFQEAVEKATGTQWNKWKNDEVSPEYKNHFHKNMGSGDYYAMRMFWSAKKCRNQEDIPTALTGVTVVNEDQLSYIHEKTGERTTALTLRGLLRARLPMADLGRRLFEHLMEEEEQVYDWAARGPRLVQEILRPRELLPAKECSEESSSTESMCAAAPDVVMLQEFDVFEAESDYRNLGKREAFCRAMANEGYASVLFRDPMEGRKPPQGLGIFWRRAHFDLEGASLDGDAYSAIWDLHCGSSLPSAAAYNIDLLEHWHKIEKDGSCEEQLMDSADRRNVALLRLRHRASGQPVWVVNCHLMTTSRDSAKTNAFPGEVRAGELRAIRQEIQCRIPPGEALIFGGDFNTNAQELHTFSAPLRRNRDDVHETLSVDIGLSCSGAAGPLCCRRLLWQAGSEPLHLREAFEPVHQWGPGVGSPESGGHCSSFNANRIEWIDYMWYSEGKLKPVARSDMHSPAKPVPDREHGSDHLPLAVLFELC